MDEDRRRCTVCEQWKPIDDFPRNRTKRGGRETRCKVCATAAAKRWYVENTDRKHAYDAAYREKHQERRRAQDRAYYRRHRPRILRRVSAYARQLDPALRNARANIRWHRTRLPGGDLTLAAWQAVCAQYGHRCLACGSAGRLTIDHVIPLSQGGPNTIANVQPLCFRCNRRKSACIIDYRPSAAAPPPG